MNYICIRCGATIEKPSSRSKYCKTCSEIANKESRQKAWKKQAEERKARKLPERETARVNESCAAGIEITADPKSMQAITEHIKKNGGSYYPTTYKPDPPYWWERRDDGGKT